MQQTAGRNSHDCDAAGAPKKKSILVAQRMYLIACEVYVSEVECSATVSSTELS